MSAAGASPSSSAEDSGGFAELARALRESRRTIGLDVVLLRSVDSTNRLGRSVVRALGDELNAFLVVAWRQTAGRGRVGRNWSSPGGLGAYQSLVRRVSTRENLSLVPLRVGVALCEALRPWVPEVALKWPNDLVTPRGKLGGILIELVGSGEASTLIVGYGINVAHEEHELPLPTATSMRVESGGGEPELALLVPRLATAVNDELGREEAVALTLERCAAVTAHRPGDRMSCTLGAERFEGTFVGLDDQGRLVLDTARGRRVLSAADALESVSAGVES